MKIEVLAKLNSQKESITKTEIGIFEVRVNAQPIDGKANKRIIELLAKYFKVPKSKIALIKGVKSKNKTFLISV